MMHQTASSRWLTGLSVFILANLPLSAGVVYEIDVTDHAQSPPKSEPIETVVDGRLLKMGVAAQGGGAQGEMIFRGDRREMIVVDHDSRSYHVVDEKAMRQLAGQVDNAMSQVEEALKNLPADQRAMAEKMMKQRMPSRTPARRPRSEINNTGEQATKNGYPCVKYEVSTGRRKTREVWVTDWDNLEGGEEVIGTFEEMADFFRQLTEATPRLGRGDSGIDDNMFEFMKELRGFPVVTREFGEDGSLQRESVLRSARRQALDPSDFEPPKGYKSQEMFR